MIADPRIAWLKLGEPITPGTELAVSFARGCVAPDGTIWLTETMRANTGVCEIDEAEAVKAERFGWQRLSAEGGKVKVQRT